jgi:hypothetical protein
MDDLIVHLEFAKVLGLVALIAILITVLVYYIFRKQRKYRLLKYIPGLILILIGIYNLINLGIDLPGINEFNKVLVIVISGVGGVIALSTGLIIGIINKGRKN